MGNLIPMGIMKMNLILIKIINDMKIIKFMKYEKNIDIKKNIN